MRITILAVSIFAVAGCATSKPSEAPSQQEHPGQANAESPPPANRTPARPGRSPAPKAVVPPAAGPPLMPGTDCTNAKMPELTYDKGEHRIALARGGFKMPVPKGWKVEIERPDLTVITAPESLKGVRPVFELFVSPVCKNYESFVVHQRVAARGLAELLPTEDTTAQIAGGHWNVGLGGLVGENLILEEVTLKTKKGVRAVVVYATKLGDAKDFGLRAAAVCPKPGKKEGPLGKCGKTYFDMLGKADF